MRGRKPLPNVLKLQRGSRKLNPTEPVLPAASVEPPDDLDGAALRIWLEAIPELAKAGVVTVVDVGRAARACRWEALGRRLLAEAEGRTGPEQAAGIRLAATCHSLADKTWTALGVGDPRERNRMRGGAPEEDALAAFKKRHA